MVKLLPFLLIALSCFGQAFKMQDTAWLGNAVPQGATGTTLNNNLVAYWKLDEAQGSSRADSKGSNTLTENGGSPVGSLSGLVGNCAAFTNSLGYFLIAADNADLSMGPGVYFTITAWINVRTTAVNSGMLSKWSGNPGMREYHLVTSDSGGGHVQFQFSVRKADDTPGTTVTASNYGSVQSNVWQFVAMSYDGINVSISVNNGTPNTTAYSGDVLDGNSSFRLGTGADGDPIYDCMIDEVGVWKRALTSSELTELYNAGSGKTCCPF